MVHINRRAGSVSPSPSGVNKAVGPIRQHKTSRIDTSPYRAERSDFYNIQIEKTYNISMLGYHDLLPKTSLPNGSSPNQVCLMQVRPMYKFAKCTSSPNASLPTTISIRAL